MSLERVYLHLSMDFIMCLIRAHYVINCWWSWTFYGDFVCQRKGPAIQSISNVGWNEGKLVMTVWWILRPWLLPCTICSRDLSSSGHLWSVWINLGQMLTTATTSIQEKDIFMVPFTQHFLPEANNFYRISTGISHLYVQSTITLYKSINISGWPSSGFKREMHKVSCWLRW